MSFFWYIYKYDWIVYIAVSLEEYLWSYGFSTYEIRPTDSQSKDSGMEVGNLSKESLLLQLISVSCKRSKNCLSDKWVNSLIPIFHFLSLLLC